MRCLGVYRTAEAAGRAYDLCALAGSKKPGRLNARPGAYTLGEVLQMVGAGVPGLTSGGLKGQRSLRSLARVALYPVLRLGPAYRFEPII